MSSRPGPSPQPGSWPPVAAHGLFLLAVLLAFRVHKVIVAGLAPNPLGWAVLALPDVGFVLLFESFWLLVSRGRASRPWRWALDCGHALVYIATVCFHQFFVNTGYRLPFDLAAYAAGRLGMLSDLLMVTGGSALWRDAALAAAAFVVAIVVGRIPAVTRRPPPRRMLLPVVAALGLALVVFAPVHQVDLRNVGQNDLIAFAGSAFHRADTGGVGRWMIAPEELYSPPVLEPPAPEAAEPPRPNIVLVLLESTGAGAVGPDFSTAGLTPNLAALAADAVVLESAYGTVSHTSKALVGLLCGMLPRLELDISESLEGNLPIPCLPKLLGELGYRTAFLQTALGQFENRPGLVANLGFQNGAYQETLDRPPYEKSGYFGLDEFAMLAPAVRFASAERPEPFLLTLLTITPHHPYETPGVDPGDAEVEELYAEALRHQDRFVGALRQGLAEAGVLEETVLIVIGDHGEAFGEHGIHEHDAVPYEEVVWTPWLMHGARFVGEPRRVGGLRSHLDLVPTILDLVGARWQGTLPGRSVFAADGHERVITSCWYRSHCLGMRRGDSKAVYHFGRAPTELYDLGNDPGERQNLAGTLAAGSIAEVEAEMLAFKLSVDAFWARHPATDGPLDWWQRESATTSGGGPAD